MTTIENDLNKLTGTTNLNSKKDNAFDGIYVFLSFDLANSTAYKNLNPFWTDTFRLFREYSSKVMKEYFRKKIDSDETENQYCDLKWYVWKNLGDEIIYMFPNPDFTELQKLPDTCCSVLDKIDKSLATPTKNSSVKVSVKATLWLAEIEEKDLSFDKNSEPPYSERNINISVQDNNHYMIDFLGPDIDTGFRLSHYSNHNKITIDARLAWILFAKGNTDPNSNCILKNAKIVAYKILKGVWNEKPYPIIWYINDWNPEKLFYYYEEVQDESLPCEITNSDYKYTDITKLETILDDAKQLDYANYLYTKLISLSNKRIYSLEEIYDVHKNAELHLICLCLNEKNELLILQRASSKRFLPNIWEFGCTYLRNDISLIESLLTGYQYKIGTTVSLLNNGLPIDNIIINRKDDQLINGLVYIGRIDSTQIKINTTKYQRYKFIKPSINPRVTNPDVVVPDFERLLNKAAIYLKSN